VSKTSRIVQLLCFMGQDAAAPARLAGYRGAGKTNTGKKHFLL
jgi:hypothetical protein